MRLVVVTDVLELKTFRQVEIKLHRRQLPQPADRILHLDVNLWSIERCFIFHALVWKFLLVQRVDQSELGILPLIVRAEIFLARIRASDREFDLELCKTERTQQREGKMNAIDNLATYLCRRTENVRIVLGETTDPHQTMQSAGKLGAIAGSEFCITKRQIAIRVLRRFENADVERTVHRLQTKLGFFQFGRRKHDICVVFFVAAHPPQIPFCDVRRKHQPVTALLQFFTQVRFHLAADRAALRMPQHQALPVFFLN